MTLKSTFTDIATAIRTKNGASTKYAPTDMAAAIKAIESSPIKIAGSGDYFKGFYADADATTPYDINSWDGKSVVYAKLIELGELKTATFTDATEAELQSIFKLAKSGDVDLSADLGWKVGDTRNITISKFTSGDNEEIPEQTVDIAISSFKDYNGAGAKMQFDFKDCLSVSVQMNSSQTNSGGWPGSLMYKKTIPALVEALPSWLKNNMIPFTTKTSKGAQSSEIEETAGNLLALRSEIEIFGSAQYSKNGEGEQADYYKASSNRIKKLGHSGSASSWWERAPYGTSSSNFCLVLTGGSASYNIASGTYGLAPFGCI